VSDQTSEHGLGARPPGADAGIEETVDALVALGVDEERARLAVEENAVPLILVQEGLGGERPYTLEEVAEKAEIEAEVLRRIFLALGLPLRDKYGDSDLREAEQVKGLLEFFSLESLVRLARVRGIAVARIAMGDLNAVRDEMVRPLRESGADDLAIAVRLAESSKGLLPVASNLLEHAYRRALVHVLSSEIVRAATQETGSEIDLAVGFVDLVGYTALSARVDPHGLDEVLDIFEHRVFETTSATVTVTLVKFLGDAAMLVAPDPAELADVLLDLLDPIDELEESPMRAGMAAGPTLVRDGDYFGPAVNMAARLTDRARPWSLLADDDLEEQMDDRYRLSRVRPMRLRGVGLRRPLAVKRADE
jgi:adenylate cyclase